MKSPYGPLAAEFYQITKPVGAEYQDIAYYAEQLSDHKGKILEIGSGTGRFLLPLLEAGFEMEGLENNPHMNAWCLKNARILKVPSPRLIREDLRTWKAPDRCYEAIVFSFGSLQLFTDWFELESLLKKLHRALKSKGKIYIDIDVTRTDLGRASLKMQGPRVECDDGSEISLEASKTFDFVNQVESNLIRYEKWKAGKLKSCEIQELEIRWMGVQEMRLLLKDLGFQNISYCFDYQKDSLQPNAFAEVVCFEASK